MTLFPHFFSCDIFANPPSPLSVTYFFNDPYEAKIKLNYFTLGRLCGLLQRGLHGQVRRAEGPPLQVCIAAQPAGVSRHLPGLVRLVQRLLDRLHCPARQQRSGVRVVRRHRVPHYPHHHRLHRLAELD